MKKRDDFEARDAEIAKIDERMAELAAARDEYYSLSSKRDALSKALEKDKKREREKFLVERLKFVDCQFPDVGVEGRDGSCYIEEEADIKELCKILSSYSYYNAYFLKEWQGKGKYKIIPEYRYDHDGEQVNSGIIIKEEK